MPSPISTPHRDPRPPLDMPLWTGMAAPMMRFVFPPVTVPGSAALIIFRGGAYAKNDGTGEGTAEWAARHGMVGIEVGYRTRATGDAYPRNYADAARAVRLVRGHWQALGVDPNRIGVLGYSAGAHLATLLSTRPELYVDENDGLGQDISARPDFVVLGQPLISFVEGYAPGAFASSTENFFGRPDVDEVLRRQFSNENFVLHGHPPVFMWATATDAIVPASQARIFANACERHRVDVTYREFAEGPHGLGLALDAPGEARAWTELLVGWLREHRIIS